MSGIVEAYRRAFAGLPRAAWILAFAALVNRAGTMVMPFLGLYLVSQRGVDAGQVGLVLAAFGAGGLAGGYLGGWASDRAPAVYVQVLTLVGTGALYLCIPLVDRLAFLPPLLFLTGVVAEAFRPANMVVLTAACPAELRTRAIVLHRLAVNLGMSIGPAVGGFLAASGYGRLFTVDALTCFGAALILWLSVAPSAPLALPPGAPPDRSPWQDRPYLLALLGTLGIGCMFFQLGSTYPLYLHGPYGLDEAEIGLVLGLNAVVIVAFEMVLLERLKARPPLQVIGVGAALTGLGFGALPWGRGLGYAFLTVLPWSVGEMLSISLLTAFVAERAGERSRGRYLGLFTQTFGAAFILGPAIGTWVYAQLGPDWVWYGCLGLGIGTGGLFFALARHLGVDLAPQTK